MPVPNFLQTNLDLPSPDAIRAEIDYHKEQAAALRKLLHLVMGFEREGNRPASRTFCEALANDRKNR